MLKVSPETAQDMLMYAMPFGQAFTASELWERVHLGRAAVSRALSELADLHLVSVARADGVLTYTLDDYTALPEGKAGKKAAPRPKPTPLATIRRKRVERKAIILAIVKEQPGITSTDLAFTAQIEKSMCSALCTELLRAKKLKKTREYPNFSHWFVVEPSQ